jgi:N-acetylneuraminic acid mutarotase
MIMKFKYLILFLFFTCVACERYEDRDVELLHTESWDVDFGLATGNAVVYNDTLYVLFGREEGGDAENPSTKFRYAAMGDLANFEEEELPLKPRVNATAIVVGSKMYAGLGFRGRVYGVNAYLRDWWEYDFGVKKWRQLADFPTKDVVAPLVWEDDGDIYTIYGSNEEPSGVVYRYDIEGDVWEVYSDETEPWARYRALGGVVDGILYCGGVSTFDAKQYWWRYDWRINEWEECARVPKMARFFASSVVVDDCIYVLGGRFLGGTETREYFYETIIFYDTRNDEWVTLGRMEQAAENMIAFECGGDLYWGLGQCQDGSFVKKIYRRDMRIKN